MWHISHMMTNCPSSGRCHDHVTHFWILHPWNISGTANVRDFEVCILVGRVKYQLCDTWLSRRWTGSLSRDPFLHFWAQAISLERINLDISNLVCRLNVNSTGIKHVKVLQYGMYLRSRDLLQFFTTWCYASAVLAMGLCPSVSVFVSVCPSVTSRSSTKTTKHRITQTTPHNSPETLVFWC